MVAAIDIIAENIPDLEALNLNDNKIHHIDHLRILPTKLKNVKILYIGDNRVRRNFCPLSTFKLYIVANLTIKSCQCLLGVILRKTVLLVLLKYYFYCLLFVIFPFPPL